MKEMKMRNEEMIYNTQRGTTKTKWSWPISSFLHSLFLISHFSFLICITACDTIDEDLSDCGFEVNYELKLVTNIQTKLQTQLRTDLSLQTNVELTTALEAHLGTIFRDHADDVDLSFYDVQGDSTRLEHDQHFLNGKEEQYTLNIPRRHYLHLATANVGQEVGVEAYDVDKCHDARLSQTHLDTVPSHTTGLFSARYDMDIKDSISQTFNVHLYMANSATVLVVDTLGSHVRDIQVYATGFASGFHMADSTYTFSDVSPIVRAERVDILDKRYACFTTVNFPSRDQLVIPIGAPRRADESDVEALWEYHIYITTASGSVTRSVVKSHRPLHAEQVLVAHVKLEANGEPTTSDPTLGISVTTDWGQGGQYDPIL